MDVNDELSPDEVAAATQQELLESCLEIVFDAYDEAVREKMIEPVVFVIDCEDDIGEEIANCVARRRKRA